MDTGIDGVGEAVTGGMVARAVEPEAGEAVEQPEDGACHNCGASLAGPFCHACGQKARIHRTLGAFWHDLVHSVLHFEGKIWRTLPMLAWRPGELTRRYIHGERARFVSPTAMFLFSVFLMFAVFSALGGLSPVDPSGVRAGVAEEVRGAEAAVARLERERAASAGAGRATVELDRRLAEAREQASLLRELSERGVAGATIRISDDIPPALRWLEAPVRKANENPALLLYKLQTNAYKFSWALIPISVPFLWLLFLHRRRWRREYGAYDHLVFVTYSIAFMSLLFIVSVLLGAVSLGGGIVALLVVLVPPVHIYRQLRGAYLVSRFGAAWRTAVLMFFAFGALTLFLLLLLAIGVLG